MPLSINIEDLLNKHKVESNRIEFKKGWNPSAIYHSICAFANDFDNIGGGYVLVGVEEHLGVAKRPVSGIPIEQLDKIQNEIVNLNNLIDPYYAPQLSVEGVDGTQIQEANTLRSRRYRNRRLGEFLKELDLTEGRATGIPTIQEELKKNGSGRASIETDEDRTFFLIDIPCHPHWVNMHEREIKVIEKLTERQQTIINLIKQQNSTTQPEIARMANVGKTTIYKEMKHLMDMGIIQREGARKDGRWIITISIE